MRIGSRVFRAAVASASTFRPHIHQSPCVICNAAVAETQDAGSVSPCSSSDTSAIAATTGGNVCDAAPFLSLHARDPVSTEDGVKVWLTIRERRAEALLQWMRAMGDSDGNQPPAEDARLQRCWEAYCDTARPLSDDDLSGAIDFLDRLCQVKLDDGATTTTTTTESALVQERESHQGQQGPAKDGNVEAELPDNAFLTCIKASLATPADVEKQLRFQRTLLDFRQVAESLQLPFFLCCGTALAAHREGYFIPHDDDIDVGVFYEDLQRMCIAAEKDAQSTVVGLLSHMARDGRFVTFDICGTVEKGLELRFLHCETQVALDLNVYYLPLLEDAALVAQCGPFVWAATHYEDAALRCHGMYRYRHAPFAASLMRMPFCDPAATSSAGGFLVPPKSYLSEYFGDDWHIPKQFTYADGLHRGEYKNIIEE